MSIFIRSVQATIVGWVLVCSTLYGGDVCSNSDYHVLDEIREGLRVIRMGLHHLNLPYPYRATGNNLLTMLNTPAGRKPDILFLLDPLWSKLELEEDPWKFAKGGLTPSGRLFFFISPSSIVSQLQLLRSLLFHLSAKEIPDLTERQEFSNTLANELLAWLLI